MFTYEQQRPVTVEPDAFVKTFSPLPVLVDESVSVTESSTNLGSAQVFAFLLIILFSNQTNQ